MSNEFYLTRYPYLRTVDNPELRRYCSFQADKALLRDASAWDGAPLATVHCFYEAVRGEPSATVNAALQSMVQVGHSVNLWTYTPERLSSVNLPGVRLRDASEILNHALFQQVVERTEVRYFSDIFRYAVLYQLGGLWLDTDIIMLRPFQFKGDHFLNLQWRGGHVGHFICGNVIYAEQFSIHMRRLFQKSMDIFHGPDSWEFGAIGPRLLSDYVASDEGVSLRGSVFSPTAFNSIDWSERDLFERPLWELKHYLNDRRVIGVHAWDNNALASAAKASHSFASLLLNPGESFPRLTNLADQFEVDRNRVTGLGHGYTIPYDALFSPHRLSAKTIIQIGSGSSNEAAIPPSVEMWQRYFPFTEVILVDNNLAPVISSRLTILSLDAERMGELSEKIADESVDIIIDNGTHSSYAQQLALTHLFPKLRPGGLFCIESLDWQPPGELSEYTPTKELMSKLPSGSGQIADPLGVLSLANEIERVLFFDSQAELARRGLLDGLVVLQKGLASRVNEAKR